MKGVVFTEFLEMVEREFGPIITDRIITEAQTSTGGAYTTVGTYDHTELVAMVVKLSEATGAPANVLVRTFGKYMFGRFVVLFPQFFKGVLSAFDFLSRVDQYIHPEVRKLYPDAELPSFRGTQQGDQMELIYRSTRHFADLAEGLILGCADHFGEKITLAREAAEGGAIRFLLTRIVSLAA